MKPSDSEYVLVRRDSLPNLQPPQSTNPSAPPTPTPARSPTLPSYVVTEYQTTLRPPNPAPVAQGDDPNTKICQVLVLCQREFNTLHGELKHLKIIYKHTTQGIEDTHSRLCCMTWIFSLCFLLIIGFLVFHLFFQN